MSANERAESYQSVQFQVPVQSHPSEIGTVLAEGLILMFQLNCCVLPFGLVAARLHKKSVMQRPVSSAVYHLLRALNQFILKILDALSAYSFME